MIFQLTHLLVSAGLAFFLMVPWAIFYFFSWLVVLRRGGVVGWERWVGGWEGGLEKGKAKEKRRGNIEVFGF